MVFKSLKIFDCEISFWGRIENQKKKSRNNHHEDAMAVCLLNDDIFWAIDFYY